MVDDRRRAVGKKKKDAERFNIPFLMMIDSKGLYYVDKKYDI